jgi:HEAT repeat protein
MRAIFPAILILIGWIQPARAEEPHTFRGKTAEGWIAVFRDKASSDLERRQAVWILGCFGEEGRAAVPDLIDAARKGQFQDEAVDALVQIGAGAEVTVPNLIGRFLKRGCQHPTRMGSFPYDPSLENSLARIGGPAVPALLEILNGPNGDMRVCAAEALGRIGPEALAADLALIRAIEHPDPEREPEILVLHAIRALGRIGPEARAAIPALNGSLGLKIADTFDHSFDVVIALDRIGAPPVRKLLDHFLRDGDSHDAEQLAWLGPKAREAVPALRTALADHRLQVRFSAATALAHIEPSVMESIPVLIEALDHLHDDALEVMEVPEALARLGPRARAALPTLIGLAKKGPDDTGLLETMVQIDLEGTGCVPVLIELLKSEDEVVVDDAARSLGLQGPRAKGAVPALADVLTRHLEDHGGDLDAKVSAAQSLRRIGSDAKSAIPALIGALRHRRVVRQEDGGVEVGGRCDCAIAKAAAETLGSLGPAARAAIPALIEVVRIADADDVDWSYTYLRQAAILALGQIGPDARVAIPVLRDFILEDPTKTWCQPEAAIALYRLAPDGKEIAERWLETPMSYVSHQIAYLGLEGRAKVLGAMGRVSFETDWLTRRYLERIDQMLALDPNEDYEHEFLQESIETLGSFGTAGRLAIPRLNEFRKHPNPWVRMWAAEALERIVTGPSGRADSSRRTGSRGAYST